MSDTDKQSYMEFSSIKWILEQYPAKTLNVIGAGEPLCHPQWRELTAYMKQYGMTLQMSTNGTLLSEEAIRDLPRGSIYFSLDTLSEERYREIRGGDLNVVLQNIRLLHTLRPNDIKIYLQPVVTKNFMIEAIKYLDFTYELQAAFSPIYPSCYTQELYEELYPSEYDKRLLVQLVNNRIAEGKIQIFNAFSSGPLLNHCPDPFNQMFIAINGDIWPCCYAYSARPYIVDGGDGFDEWYGGVKVHMPAKDYRLGNIFEGTFDHEKLLNIRRKIGLTGEMDFQFRGRMSLKDNEYCRVCLNRWGVAC